MSYYPREHDNDLKEALMAMSFGFLLVICFTILGIWARKEDQKDFQAKVSACKDPQFRSSAECQDIRTAQQSNIFVTKVKSIRKDQ